MVHKMELQCTGCIRMLYLGLGEGEQVILNGMKRVTYTVLWGYVEGYVESDLQLPGVGCKGKGVRLRGIKTTTYTVPWGRGKGKWMLLRDMQRVTYTVLWGK